MKELGIVRKLDQINRVTIPRELCKSLNLGQGTPMEIFSDGQQIIFRKYRPGCVFCGGDADVEYRGVRVCRACVRAFALLAEKGEDGGGIS